MRLPTHPLQCECVNFVLQAVGVHGVSQLLLNYAHEALLTALYDAHVGNLVWRDEPPVRALANLECIAPLVVIVTVCLLCACHRA